MGDRERRRAALEPVRPPVAAGHDRAGPARAPEPASAMSLLMRTFGAGKAARVDGLTRPALPAARPTRARSAVDTPSSRRSSAAASISSTRRAACARLPSSRRSRSGRPITAAISSFSQSPWPAASAARHALDGRGGQALHEHRADELHRRGVACLVGDDLDGHPERAEHLGERLGGGAGGERGRADSLRRYRAEQGDVREAFADEPGKLALEGRRGRVQVAVDGLAREGWKSIAGRPERHRRRVHAEHDVRAGDRGSASGALSGTAGS